MNWLTWAFQAICAGQDVQCCVLNFVRLGINQPWRLCFAGLFLDKLYWIDTYFEPV